MDATVVYGYNDELEYHLDPGKCDQLDQKLQCEIDSLSQVNKTKEAKIIEANATVTAQKIVLQDEVALYLNFDSGLSLNSD